MNYGPASDIINSALRHALGIHDAVDPTDRFRQYRGRPNEFMGEVLGVTNWEAPRKFNEVLIESRMVTWRSCRSSSKTFNYACLVLYFINCYVCELITIGASWENVRDQVWGNVGKLHANAKIPLIGSPDVMQYRIGPKHYAKGFAAVKSERSMGYHSERIMPDDIDAPITEEELEQLYKDRASEGLERGMLVFLVDEASGVPQNVLEPLIGSMSPNTYMALAGQPVMEIDEPHLFATSHRDDSGFVRFKTAAVPNDDPVTADYEWDSIPPALLFQKTIRIWEQQWGRTSPMWAAHVEARFAGEGVENQLIPLALLVAAETREPALNIGPWMGVDIAESQDECCASLWYNGVRVAEHAWRPAVSDEQKMMSIAQTIIHLAVTWGEELEPLGWKGKIPPERINVDKSGMAGVTDRLSQSGWNVGRIDFGGGPQYAWPELTGELQFQNMRAEMHWVFRRVLEEGLARLPRRWSESWREAQWPRYEFADQGGKTLVKIESKKLIKARHKRSPDYLDSDILAWARPDRNRPTVRRVRVRRVGR